MRCALRRWIFLAISLRLGVARSLPSVVAGRGRRDLVRFVGFEDRLDGDRIGSRHGVQLPGDGRTKRFQEQPRTAQTDLPASPGVIPQSFATAATMCMPRPDGSRVRGRTVTGAGSW